MTTGRRRRLGCRLALMATGAALFAGGCDRSPVTSQPPSPSADQMTATSTMAPTSASPGAGSPPQRFANPQDYASDLSRYPSWGFVTPSSTWICVIGKFPSGGDNAACAINPNQGPLPIPNVPPATGPGGPDGLPPPNAMAISESSEPAFEALDDSIWDAGSAPRALPYGTVLQAGGFSCNAQEAAVSCRNDSTGRGFSVSTTSYRYFYTDVPAG